MPVQDGQWICFEGGLRLGDSLLSFQRYPRPTGPFSAASVRSYGALQPARTTDGIVLPVAEQEAFWIGAILSEAHRDDLVLHARLADERCVELSGTWQAALLLVAGFTDRGMLCPFARPQVRSIGVRIGCAVATATLVAPNDFARLTGRDAPQPLHDDGIYKGWRLP